MLGRFLGHGAGNAPLQGYTQGMHDIAAILFIVFSSDGFCEDVPSGASIKSQSVGRSLRQLQPKTWLDVEADTFFCLHALLSYDLCWVGIHALAACDCHPYVDIGDYTFCFPFGSVFKER